MKKAIFIYNPNSGKKTRKKIKAVADFKKIKAIFTTYDYDVTFIETKYQGHARKIVRELPPLDLVISVGGDGTYNEVMSGNFERKQRLVLSHLPYGTTNDIGSMFGLGKNLYNNINLILSGKVCGIDICTLNGRPFTYTAGFGKFMNVPYETTRNLKKRIGKNAYIINGIHNFFHQKTNLYELTYEIDGVKQRGFFSFLLVSNANRIAGIDNFYKDVKLDDNYFELLFCSLSSRKEIIKSLFYLTTGRITEVPGFTFYRTNNLKITFHSKLKKPWCVDGEKFASNTNQYEIKIVNNIQVLLPKKVIPKLFIEGEKNELSN